MDRSSDVIKIRNAAEILCSLVPKQSPVLVGDGVSKETNSCRRSSTSYCEQSVQIRTKKSHSSINTGLSCFSYVVALKKAKSDQRVS